MLQQAKKAKVEIGIIIGFVVFCIIALLGVGYGAMYIHKKSQSVTGEKMTLPPEASILSGISIYKPKGAKAVDILEESLQKKFSGDKVAIKFAIFPLHVEVKCDAEHSCEMDIESKGDFPEKDIPCSCKDGSYLIKIFEEPERKADNEPDQKN